MKKSFYFGAGLLGLIITFSLFGPSFSGYSSENMVLSDKNLPPSSLYWFGTDALGRDMFTRVSEGAKISLLVGISAALIDLVFGVCYAAVAVLYGGRTDEILMRFADMLYSLPYVLVVTFLIMAIGSGVIAIIAGLSVICWIPMARIVRGQFLQLSQKDYVLAARAMGSGSMRLLLRHLLPNSMGPIAATLTLTIPSAIYMEAFLSFLGLGVSAPAASLGTLANEGLPALAFFPLRLLIPAGVICLIMVSLHLICEGIQERYRLSEKELY